MRHLILILSFITFGTTVFGLGYCIGQPGHQPRSLATKAVLQAEPDAKCVDLYRGGDVFETNSAVCTLPNKTVVLCSMRLDEAFSCHALSGAPAAPQAQAPAGH